MREVVEGSVCRGRDELPPGVGEYLMPLRVVRVMTDAWGERWAEVFRSSRPRETSWVTAASLVPMTPAEAEDWGDWRKRR